MNWILREKNCWIIFWIEYSQKIDNEWLFELNFIVKWMKESYFESIFAIFDEKPPFFLSILDTFQAILTCICVFLYSAKKLPKNRPKWTKKGGFSSKMANIDSKYDSFIHFTVKFNSKDYSISFFQEYSIQKIIQ